MTSGISPQVRASIAVANSGRLFLTPNPPNSLCVIDDFWFRYVADHHVLRTPTYTNRLVVRALGGVPDIRSTRVHPLAQAGDPPETKRAGQCTAIGLVKGEPFAPDERMRRLLAQAAALAAAAARALVYRPRDPRAYLYPGGTWLNAFLGGSYEFLRNHARLLDARAQFHYFATVITPAMGAARAGTGSAYAYTAMDSNHVMGRDTGGAELSFGPEPPPAGETTWVRTVPGKSFFAMPRLYGPLEAWFDRTWRPGDIEPLR
ncbi:hypothetical protein ACFY36_05910 [Actinoplanes sp. NPDC000266]